MYSQVDGFNLYYQKVGQGPDLVMLHGWGQDVSTWWPILDGLKQDFTVWLVDLPGFGRSERGTQALTISKYVGAIEEFIRINKLKKPILVGHSLGGRVGIKLAARHPELLGKLVLEDSAGLNDKNDRRSLILLPIVKAGKLLIPNWFNLRERTRRWIYQMLHSDYYEAGEMKETLQKVVEEDLSAELPKIQTETLVLWGEIDRTTPLWMGRQFYRQITKSRLEIIEGAGHFPHLERPQQFLYWLKDFA